MYERVKNVFSDEEVKVKIAECLVLQAQEYFSAEKYSDGLKCVNRAMELAPPSDTIFYWKANMLSMLDRDIESLRCFNEAIKMDAENEFHSGRIRLLFDRSIQYIKMDMIEKSIPDVKQCGVCCDVVLKEPCRFSRQHLKFLTALQSLLRVCAQSKDSKKYKSIKPKLLLTLSRSRQLFDTLKHPRPGEEDHAKAMVKRFKEMTEQMSAGDELSKEDIAEAYLKKARHYQEKKEYQNAVASAKRALQASDTHVDSYILLAECHRELNARSAALAAIEKALEVDRDSFPSHVLRAQLLHKEDRLGEAMGSYLAASRLRPQNNIMCNQ
jgi:tetratricopeptide (TPR) repeat protein